MKMKLAIMKSKLAIMKKKFAIMIFQPIHGNLK